MKIISDVLVLGGGPAALSIVAELVEQGLSVHAIALNPPDLPWPNTYGIWAEEVESLGLASLLKYRWKNTVSFFGNGIGDRGSFPVEHKFDYGLFDQNALQTSLLIRCKGVSWDIDTAQKIMFLGDTTQVLCSSGNLYKTRLVIDASGHSSQFIKRPNRGPVAQQAAYGVVGRFSSPPVDNDQFVLMDFRPDHLNKSERHEPPSFLYAMDFGEGVFFVEETSLACFPAFEWGSLKERLYKRLSHRGVEIKEVLHEEYCLFPMNLPLPDRRQSVLAFGGSASMVHPASGYMVGSLLRRAPALAKLLAREMAKEPFLDSTSLARKGWNVLWTPDLILRHRLYQFGIHRLMSFDEECLRTFFATFFRLQIDEWHGFLANTLPSPRLFLVMLKLFALAPLQVKMGMICGGSFLKKLNL